MDESRRHAVRHTGTHILPLGIGAGRDRIEAFAEEFGVKNRLAVGGPLEPILRAFDAKVVRFEGLDVFRTASLLFAEPKARPIVGVPFGACGLRERADMAQAIAHLVLHRPGAAEAHPDLPLRVPYWPGHETDEGWRTAVRESHWFAWALLMPSAEFTAEWESENGATAKVARTFGVSSKWAEWRADYLDLAAALPARPTAA